MQKTSLVSDFKGPTLVGSLLCNYSFFHIALSKSAFNYQYCIGKGGFGKVWKVERKKTKQQYAMKEMSKARILTKRSLKSVMNERQILTQLNNPFIVNMYYAF
jgi:serine/threonine protein kinase